MSGRWDGILKFLPRPLRNTKLLDAIDAHDHQLKAGKAYGSLGIEAHYSGGDPRETKLVAASEKYGPPDLSE